MAAESRTNASSLAYEILSDSRHYSFFQAVNLLSTISENKAQLGGIGPAREEPIRFRAHASLAHPVSDIETLTTNDKAQAKDDQLEMVVNFLGLYGPSSPLPAFYTEEILFDESEPNNRQDFLDLFNHRAISLLYRTWEKYRYYIRYRKGASDPISQYMFALIGLGDKNLRQNIDLDWRKLLSYLGVISIGSRSASVLQGILSHYFNGIEVEIEQCVAKRIRFDAQQACRLGIENTTLSVDAYCASIGGVSYDRNSKFRVVIHNLTFEEYQRYLPCGDRYLTLCNLIKLVMTDQYEFDIELKLMEQVVPRLYAKQDNECRLGWSAWLGETPKQSASVLIASPKQAA